MINLQRFPTQDVVNLERETLLQLFSSYAVPKGRRGAAVIGTNETETKSTDELNEEQHTNLNNNKRPRHALITAPSVETVTNACKKIRLVNSAGIQSTSSSIYNNPVFNISQKRQIVGQMVSFPKFWNKEFWLIVNCVFFLLVLQDCAMSDQPQQMPSNTKRKKITWPWITLRNADITILKLNIVIEMVYNPKHMVRKAIVDWVTGIDAGLWNGCFL